MLNALQIKYKNYLTWVHQQQDQYGFIDHKYCDALLFSCLTGCVPGVQFTPWAAFDESRMMWHRRPLDKPCYTCGDLSDPQGSTISRDMLIGLLWYAWIKKDLTIANTVVQRAIKHVGFMGCAGSVKVKLSKCQIMPPLFVTALLIRNKLQGGKWYDRLLKYIPASVGKDLVGFQAHLQVLHILLRKDVTGYISAREQKILDKQAKRMPDNSLFQIAVGNYELAEKTLLREDLFPSTKLPTTKNRSEFWLWQRDSDDSDGDWLPRVGKEVVHAGGDFLFAYWLMEYMKRRNNG